MRIRGGEFSTGTMGNFQPELTIQARLNKKLQGVPYFLSHNRGSGQTLGATWAQNRA